MFIMGVSLSNVIVSICIIFVGTLLKCHGTSNSTTQNVMHWPCIVTNEWGQRWNLLNMCLYASKFDMVRLDTCLDDMGGFQDSRMYDVIQKHFEKISTLAPFTGHCYPSCTLVLIQCLLIVVSFKIRSIIKLKRNKDDMRRYMEWVCEWSLSTNMNEWTSLGF